MAGEAGHRMAQGKGWEGPISKLRNNNRRSLGLEWSMSKVGNPPPHNSEKPHGLVASINYNNIIVSDSGTVVESLLVYDLPLVKEA